MCATVHEWVHAICAHCDPNIPQINSKFSLQMRNDRKVSKLLFRPTFSFVFVAVLIITVIFSMIESTESTNRALIKVFVLRPMI
jgi:uncharacterized protein YqhQ